jgi:hypothetical protein
LAQIVFQRFRLGEISCPTRYFTDASSFNFSRSVKYGLGVLATSVRFRLQTSGILNSEIFSTKGQLPAQAYYREIEKQPREKIEA